MRRAYGIEPARLASILTAAAFALGALAAMAPPAGQTGAACDLSTFPSLVTAAPRTVAHPAIETFRNPPPLQRLLRHALPMPSGDAVYRTSPMERRAAQREIII